MPDGSNIVLSAPALQTEAPPSGPVRTPESIHPATFYLLGGMFLAMLGVFLLTFMGDAQTVFAIAVCVVYAVMFFGTPWVMVKAGRWPPKQTSWSEFLDDRIETFTGSMSGRDAFIQLCSVPAALMVGVTAICVIINFSR